MMSHNRACFLDVSRILLRRMSTLPFLIIESVLNNRAFLFFPLNEGPWFLNKFNLFELLAHSLRQLYLVLLEFEHITISFIFKIDFQRLMRFLLFKFLMELTLNHAAILFLNLFDPRNLISGL